MRYYQLEGRLVARETETAYDLTSASADLASFLDLAEAASIAGESIDAIAERHTDAATTLDLADVEGAARRPLDPDEVWAAGVTYRISEEARVEESGMPDMYLDVYDAERPEIFFKATPEHTVGPGEPVGIRTDSDWDVPEPELGVVLYRGDIVGYTIGNDMSSRAIEGANPLYLPQAKIYDRSCALGPCVASAETVGDPHDLSMSMRIDRDGEILYDEETSTAKMARSCEELVSYNLRHNNVPRASVLLTGTSLVPEDDFTLEPGDQVRIDIESIGTLENSVLEV